MNQQNTNDDVLGVNAPPAPSRPFFTPLNCCLGCAGLVVICVIVLVGAGYYVYSNLIVDTPIAIEMPVIPDADVASAQQKAKGIADGTIKDTTFSQNELNALLQDFLVNNCAKNLKVDPAKCKGRVDFTPENQVKFALSVPTEQGKYLNVEAQGTIVIENGEGDISGVKYARIGAWDFGGWFAGNFGQIGRQQADRFMGRVEGKLDTFKVENGQAHVVFSVPPRVVPPEK